MLTQSLKSALLGRERLWRVWWVYGLSISVCTNILRIITIGADRWVHAGVGVVVGILTTVWAVMTWRCADNSNLHIGAFVRASLIFGVIGLIAMLLLFKDAYLNLL
jgi:hypothetical protein